MEQEKKGVIGTIIDGLRESTKIVHETNKENMAAIKADSKANFKKATTPSPEFVEFKEVKGIKGKAKAALKGLKLSAKTTAEKEKERREKIYNHIAYKELLSQQRMLRQAAIGKKQINS